MESPWRSSIVELYMKYKRGFMGCIVSKVLYRKYMFRKDCNDFKSITTVDKHNE